jgi:hypothetical protein
VDQFGVPEDKSTLVMSIQDRVFDVKTNTQNTPIFGLVESPERIMRLSRNVFLPQLRKLLDSNGHIRSGQQRENVLDTLSLKHFSSTLLVVASLETTVTVDGGGVDGIVFS